MASAADSAHPDVPDTAALAARELRAVFSRLRRTLRETSATSDLTPSQTAVLSRLINDGPASASALAAAERVRPQSMAATVAALEEHGLVGRSPDPEDGRRQVVSLTETGLAYVAGRRQARQGRLARAMADHYTEAERATVLEALALIDRLNR
ncbi:MarR family winged helix-turn-helix transcriptional regulator [Kitasatospora brasiliensis]|uniref:MarR family winged helix-turn-helix transcriptional regulator n=1 Tax=Kitasatospora brasiliensis TaxID=3058040 RepID=UPI00292F3522|nr:MarR family transcriptional regulator [Kitasatospora sp. K002]